MTPEQTKPEPRYRLRLRRSVRAWRYEEGAEVPAWVSRRWREHGNVLISVNYGLCRTGKWIVEEYPDSHATFTDPEFRAKFEEVNANQNQ